MKLRHLALVALLAGCQASPSPTLYTLAAVPGAVVTTRPLAVELRRVGLAGYLDRPELVRGTVQYRLVASETDRWGEPLGRMIDRVLTEDLVERLPGSAVFVEAGAISTRADTVLEMDIQRCDADPDGTLVLLAQVAIRPDGRAARAQTLRFTRSVAGPGGAAHAAAISQALGALADAVGGMLAQP